MRTKLIESNKPEKYIHVVRNAESSATIPRGAPVILNLSSAPQPTTYSNGLPIGFEDGLQVVLPSTAGATPSLFFGYGVALGAIPSGQLGEVQVHGVVPYALVVNMTRSASSASWSSSASSSSVGGFLLSVDTVNNAFATYASSASIGTIFAPALIMLDSIASSTASATATSDTRTAIMVGYRAFIRTM